MEPMKPMDPIQPMEPMKPMAQPERWWPQDFGWPRSSGSQNGMRYAFFPDRRRLVVDRGGAVTTYDTGEHRIDGVSQSHPDRPITFTSQHGPVDLSTLERL